MRFPRNAKIFRGQLDMAPLAGVLFLLLIFILLSSLVYIPGIPYQLSSNLAPSETQRKVLTITRKGEIIFGGKTNKVEDLSGLSAEFKKLPAHSVVMVKIEPSAPRQLAQVAREQAGDLPITFELPPIELPDKANWSGTPNQTVIVGVNLGGQYFYQNQLVSEEKLREKLFQAVRET